MFFILKFFSMPFKSLMIFMVRKETWEQISQRRGMITMQPSEKSGLRKRRDGQQRERMRGFPRPNQCTYRNCFCTRHGLRAKWPIRSKLIPDSVTWSNQEYFYSPLDGMLVHCRVTPSIKVACTHLYTWVERGTVKVKCLALEHNAMSPVRIQTRTAWSREKCANHEASAPSTRHGACLLTNETISSARGHLQMNV